MPSPFHFYTHYLKQLSQILQKAKQRDLDGALLHSKLAPDMFPLHQQVTTTISFAVRALEAIAGVQSLETRPTELSYGALIEKVDEITAQINHLPALSWTNYQEKQIHLVAGFEQQTFSGVEYLSLFSQPNFLFHLNMVYSILRSNGVPLSKGDYDGFHVYPEQFQFD